MSDPANHRKRWEQADIENLKRLAGQNTPTRVLGIKLGRTPEAVQQKANQENISLNPPNQSPRTPKKKR